MWLSNLNKELKEEHVTYEHDANHASFIWGLDLKYHLVNSNEKFVSNLVHDTCTSTFAWGFESKIAWIFDV